MFGLGWRKDDMVQNKDKIRELAISYVKSRKDALEKEIQSLAERDRMIRPHIKDLDVNQVIDEFIKTYISQIIDLACESKDAEEFGNKSSELISTIEKYFDKIGKPVSNLAIDVSMSLFAFGSGMEHSLAFKESGARYQL
jgi:DNA-binding transcriptional regulator GbsR (MarR family)